MKVSEIKICETYKMDFGWNFKVTGFKHNKIEDGAWENELMIIGLKWNDHYGEDTVHEAYAKPSDLKYLI